MIEYVFAASSPEISRVTLSVTGYTKDVSVKVITSLEIGKGSAVIRIVY